jgi:hypothetical protein
MNKWTNRRIPISRRYTDDEREAIAFDIISYIRDRSKSGKGKDGKKFPKYSKEYKESLEFKIAGKSKNKVDLTLSGDMLDSIELLDDSKGELRIGLSEDDVDHGKAEGNIRGTYGQAKGSLAKARDFLAISKNEVNKILKNYPLKDEEKREKSVLSYLTALKALGEKKDGDKS